MGEGTRHASDEAIISAYVQWMRARGLADNTVDVRVRYCRRFAALWPILEPTREAMLEAIATQPAPSSRAAMRAALRSFYAWALEDGLIESDPAAKLPPMRVPQALPRPMPDDAIREALENAPEEVRLMIMLGALAGLRRAEIARVHRHDVTPEGLRVLGKGGKVRLVPLVPELRAMLERVYGWAFPSARSPKRHMNERYVGMLMRQYLPADYTTHQLRHRFATTVYQQTHDIRAVQELLGHSSIITTQRYTAVGAEHLHAAVMSGRFAWADS